MTAICITGAPGASLLAVAAALRSCGVAPAAPLSTRGGMDMHTWHDRVAELNRRNLGPAHTGGRLWEELAIDLVVANLDQPAWAWAHPYSLELLDFWRQLDSQVRFLMVCEPRLTMARGLIQRGPLDAQANIEEPLTQWSRAHQAMLRFHLRHPTISRLVWAEDAVGAPETLAGQLNHHWGLGLPVDVPPEGVASGTAASSASNPLLDHLAALLLQGSAESEALELELVSTLGPCAASRPAAETASPMELMACYQGLADRSLLKQAQHANAQLSADLSASQQALQESKEQGELLLAQIEELAKAKGQLQTQLAAETKAKSDAIAARNAEAKAKGEAESALKLANQAKSKLSADLSAAGQELKESKEEGELLLAQLHQVQEELEKYFLQVQDKTKLLEVAERDLAETKKSKDAEVKAKQQLQAQIVELAKAKEQLQTQLAAETKAKSDALSLIHI